MRLARVCIRNFRCFGGTEHEWGLDWLPNRDLNLLIGPNGSGKTSIVDAIDLVLNWEGRTNRALVSEYDFRYCDTTKVIQIEVTLTDIRPVPVAFDSYIQFVNTRTLVPIDETNQLPDEKKHARAVIVRFEAQRSEEDGEIRWRWVLPKYQTTDFEGERELSRSQHEAIGFFRIRPSTSAGAFTLGEYSALGRHLRKLHYRLGRVPDKLRPTHTLPECMLNNLQCENCTQREACENETGSTTEPTDKQPLGRTLASIVAQARGVLSGLPWSDMQGCLGPRFGGLQSSLAAVTLGLRPSVVTAHEFIPFERLSTGEKYALSFALAVTRLPGTDCPIIIMEEPETALYPAAIGKIMAALHGANSPQLISTSHSESVLRRFGLKHIFRVGSHRSAKRIDGIATTPALLRELERLIMPGATSVLLVDKVLVVEGGGEVFASGVLDRLAAAICRTQRQQRSFASEGWTVLSANKADNIPETVEALKGLGMTVAALLDADTKGHDNAQKIKDKCPVFTYKKYNGSDVTLELALLHGLNVESRQNAIITFQKYPECNACPQKADVEHCISKNGCPLSVSKDMLKSELRDSCLHQYRKAKTFPHAFAHLVDTLATAQAGEIVELAVDS